MSTATNNNLLSYRIRPRFQLLLQLTPNEVTDKIREHLALPDQACHGKVLDGYYASLSIPKEKQHYWSPHLSLSMEEEEEGTLVRGLYGPRPGVWTFFMFLYAIIIFAGLIISIIGLANLQLGKSGAILWILPILIIAFISLYIAAYMGQQVGYGQMVHLQQFVEESLEVEIRGEE